MRIISAMALGVILMATDAPAQHTGYPITAVPFTAVKVEDAFWGPRLDTNRTVTIPYAFRQCEETGRIRNFEVADSVNAGRISRGSFCSKYGYDDSDVYKTIEGSAYSLHTHYDAALDRYLDGLIAKIARAQEPDGYLYTMRTIDPEKSWARERWLNDRTRSSHELYNLGHLYEAAVAHYAATGKRSLLDVALKSADLLCRTFGPGKMATVPGHQVTEIGLAKLYLVTGRRQYVDLAKFFLDERGKGSTYNQDHLPVLQQTEAVGHAVRAAYMYAGMADVAALTQDESYIRAVDRIWEDVVGRKLYVTGGIGAAGNIEGFGAAYELPNLSAYCETCASIANVFWNQRMFLRHGDAKYLDVVERVIYNSFLSGISMKGDRFFYPNPLEALRSEERSAWFDCACCPPNIARFMPSIPGYIYATRGDTLYVNLYIGSSAHLELSDGPVVIRQHSRYPWDGEIALELVPAGSGAFTLALRLPGWVEARPVPSDLYRYTDPRAARFSVAVNGEETPAAVRKGFVEIHRTWTKGDRVTLSLEMPVRRVTAHPSVEDDRGKLAFERGPVVFCLEGQDNPRGEVLNLVIAGDARLTTAYRGDLLGGLQVIQGPAAAARRNGQGGISVEAAREFTAIPYYAWAHRGPSQMTVWPASETGACKPAPAPTIAALSTLRASGGKRQEAVADQLPPRSSNDRTVPYFHWWPRKGSVEWLEYEFAKPATVRRAAVYWFDDTGTGECRVPASWTLLYRSGGTWKPVTAPTAYGCEKDRMNVVTFDPVDTDALRLEVQLPEEFSCGIYEWEVE